MIKIIFGDERFQIWRNCQPILSCTDILTETEILWAIKEILRGNNPQAIDMIGKGINDVVDMGNRGDA